MKSMTIEIFNCAIRRDPNGELTMSTALPSRQTRLTAGFLLIGQYFLMLTAFIVLSSAINWPVSLDDPASIALPRVITERGPMLFGYLCYFTVSLLFIPATVALNARLGLTGPIANFTLALAIFSSVAKSIGITRWLFAMPVLAKAYEVPGADQATITVIYEMLNEYAGGIGEILGISLLSGIWTIIIGSIIFRKAGRVTKPLGAFVFFTGFLLLLSMPAGFGVQSIMGIGMGDLLTINGIVWQAGLLLIGVWALTKPHEI
jgi:Domain of unknown function (DUF4386)